MTDTGNIDNTDDTGEMVDAREQRRARQAHREARRGRVMRMRNSGMTLAAIAEQVGVSVSTVQTDIDTALHDAITIPAEQYVARQLTQINDLRRAVYAKALQGDEGAFDRAVRLMERESRLLGLDAPARAVVHVSTEDFAATAATLLRDLGVEPPEAIERTAARQVTIDPDDGTAADAEVDPIIEAADDDWVNDDWMG